MKLDSNVSDYIESVGESLTDLYEILKRLQSLPVGDKALATKLLKELTGLERATKELDEAINRHLLVKLEKLVTDAADGRTSQRALKIIQEIIKSTLAVSSRSDYYGQILKILAQELNSDKGFILRFTETKEEVEILAQLGCETADDKFPEHLFSRTLINELKQKKEILRITKASEDPRYLLETSIIEMQVQAVMVAPLFLADKLVGCVYLSGHRLLSGYSEEEASLLKQVRDILSLLITRPVIYSHAPYGQTTEAPEALEPHAIIGANAQFKKVLDIAKQAAQSQAVIFIEGESGTGKELIARQIHRLSARRDQPLVVVNCAAIPENLLESELFGHEKGAFTGAVQAKPGRFELAHRGTIFLDEIGELSPALQAKLLRFLQFQEFERVGGVKTLKVDVRILSATSRDLKQMIGAGQFLDALYYRLNVINIKVPPLRERREDIILLTHYFLRKFSQQYAKQLQIDPEVYLLFEKYSFPGNIRELESLIHRSVVLCTGDYVGIEHLPQEPFELTERVRSLEKNPLSKFLKVEPKDIPELTAMKAAMDKIVEEYKEKLEERLYRKTLAEAAGNLSEAARRLGVNKGSFFRTIKKRKGPGE